MKDEGGGPGGRGGTAELIFGGGPGGKGGSPEGKGGIDVAGFCGRLETTEELSVFTEEL